jgi:DNA-binding response OmpR family regulator
MRPPTDPPAPAGGSGAAAEPPLGPKLVVLAEDSPDVQGIVRHALEADGCTVMVAADGAETLRILDDHEPDLLVLDLMMPQMSGVEVLRTLRDAGRLERLPVLVLTARSSESDMSACLEMGANDYVTKPFLLRELRTRARALLAPERPGAHGEGDAPG